MERSTIIVIDDNNDLQELIQEQLEGDGHKVIAALSAGAFFEEVKLTKPDTILLDLGLPDGDGLSLINKIKEYTDAPIIVISGKGEMVDRIVGLEMGADDYLGKPFELRELSARVKASLRRYKKPEMPSAQNQNTQEESAEKIKFGSWIMDCSKLEVYGENGEDANLTTHEFILLKALASSPNIVLSRERLFELVRSEDYNSFDRAIDVQITRIRKKLGDNAQSPSIIKTVRGVGYMFVCDTVAA